MSESSRSTIFTAKRVVHGLQTPCLHKNDVVFMKCTIQFNYTHAIHHIYQFSQLWNCNFSDILYTVLKHWQCQTHCQIQCDKFIFLLSRGSLDVANKQLNSLWWRCRFALFSGDGRIWDLCMLIEKVWTLTYVWRNNQQSSQNHCKNNFSKPRLVAITCIKLWE